MDWTEILNLTLVECISPESLWNVASCDEASDKASRCQIRLERGDYNKVVSSEDKEKLIRKFKEAQEIIARRRIVFLEQEKKVKW